MSERRLEQVPQTCPECRGSLRDPDVHVGDCSVGAAMNMAYQAVAKGRVWRKRRKPKEA